MDPTNNCPLVGCAVAVIAEVPDPNNIPPSVNVVAPVPPLATIRVPPKVIVPEVVIGPPEVVNPVVPPETSIEVTVPAFAVQPASLSNTLRGILLIKMSFTVSESAESLKAIESAPINVVSVAATKI